jgi:hypothetical protein
MSMLPADAHHHLCHESRPGAMRHARQAAAEIARGHTMTTVNEQMREALWTDLKALVEALRFYAAPETYFAVAIITDPPCGEIAYDFSEAPDGEVRLGKRAREALTDERLGRLDDAIAALTAAAQPVEAVALCQWTQDGEGSDVWHAGCGHYFCLNEGTPTDNNMKYCCYCGCQIEAAPFEEDDANGLAAPKG